MSGDLLGHFVTKNRLIFGRKCRVIFEKFHPKESCDFWDKVSCDFCKITLLENGHFRPGVF